MALISTVSATIVQPQLPSRECSQVISVNSGLAMMVSQP
jgi:hypothetical protein